MSREVQQTNTQVIDSLEDLLKIFQEGGREKKDFSIGMEFERFLVDGKTLRALPFEGDRGIGRFLEELAATGSWEKILDRGKLISLKQGGTAITLEPGGQVEISCKPHRSMEKLNEDFQDMNRQMNQIATKMGATLLERGIQPVETVESSFWMPKSRYKWMREYYVRRKSQLALEMMLMTASIQINYDYLNEEDAKKKVLLGSFLSPILSAVFANSAIEQGKLSGYVSRRIPIWQNMDTDRCGIPKFFVDGSFSFEKYRDYALDVPMYFAWKNGEYVDAHLQTFRQFLENKGGEWGPVTLGDWEFHLTTLFPEVRLKNHLEFRSVDSNTTERLISLATFWKGLFCSNAIVDKWANFFQAFSHDDLETSRTEVARNGLKSNLGRHSVLELAKELFEDSYRHFHERPEMEKEKDFLKPMKEILDRGKSPAEMMIQETQSRQKKS